MAQTSYPLPPNRVVTDAEYERLTRTSGADGILGLTSDTPVVYADNSGMQIKVRADKVARLRGFAWESGDTDFTKTVTSNASGSTRVDLVVLRLTRSTWAVTIEVRAGSPGSGAPSPVTDLGSTGVYEIGIATVTVPSGASSITAGNVTWRGWYVGEDGQIMCTSGTRPPHQANRRIWETDTGRGLISTGSDWLVTYEDTGWLAVPMLAGWTTDEFAVARYRRRNGQVSAVFGARRTGGALSSGTNTNAGQLPVGFRPAYDLRTVVALNISGYPTGIGALGTDGVFQLTEYANQIPTGRWIYFPPLSYPVNVTA